MLDAAGKKRVLLPDDFVRDFQDRPRALIERPNQPGGVLQAVGKVRLFRVAPRSRRNLCVIGLVDEKLRQRVGIQLDQPGAVWRRAHEHVGYDRLHHRRTEGEAGFGVEPAQFGDHVGQIFVADGADLLQRRKIAPRNQIEPRDQRLHRRIVAIAFLELDGQAFGEIARANAGWVEGLQDGKNRLDLADASAELVGGCRQIAGEVAGFIDHADEVMTDHAPNRIWNRQRDLLAQPLRQGRLGGDKGFEIVLVVVAAACSGSRPFRISRRHVRGARADRFGFIGGRVVERAVAARFAGLIVASRRAVIARLVAEGCGLGWRGGVARGRFVIGAVVEQRIALEFRVDIGRQVEIGELQQLDGLHQLRRHYQRLGLADLQSLGERHFGAARLGPILASSFYSILAAALLGPLRA